MGAIKNIYGIIYLVRNEVNNKIYIGQTTNFKKRLSSYKYIPKKPRLYIERAIRKYGFENFKWTQIDEAFNKEELDNKEVHWIAHYQSNDHSIGYNCSSGGSQPRLNQASIEKIRKSLIEGYATGRIKHANRGKKLVHKITEAVIASRFKKGQTPWNKGMPWSEKSCAKMSQSRRGKVRLGCREAILCMETGEIFHGVNETAKLFGLKAGNLSSTLNGRQKTWGGYHWQRVSESSIVNIQFEV